MFLLILHNLLLLILLLLHKVLKNSNFLVKRLYLVVFVFLLRLIARSIRVLVRDLLHLPQLTMPELLSPTSLPSIGYLLSSRPYIIRGEPLPAISKGIGSLDSLLVLNLFELIRYKLI